MKKLITLSAEFIYSIEEKYNSKALDRVKEEIKKTEKDRFVIKTLDGDGNTENPKDDGYEYWYDWFDITVSIFDIPTDKSFSKKEIDIYMKSVEDTIHTLREIGMFGEDSTIFIMDI